MRALDELTRVMMELQLSIRRASADSGLTPGPAFVVALPATMGRSPDVDLVLVDRTVSRRHARFALTGADWSVTNISTGNGVFVDGQAVAAGESAPIGPGTELQIGGVVLAVTALEETVPVTEPLSPLNADGPLLQIRRDGDACTVHCRGRLVSMPPIAALVLYALARSPAKVVHEWDIQSAIGRDCNLPQAISAVRRALKDLIEHGVLSADELARLTAEAHVEAVPDADLSALARQVVRARRKHGYALMLPPDSVTTQDAG